RQPNLNSDFLAEPDTGVTMAYDRNNVFARILRGELPCTKVYEDEHVLAFRDINPLAPTHVLVIPKQIARAPPSTPAPDHHLSISPPTTLFPYTTLFRSRQPNLNSDFLAEPDTGVTMAYDRNNVFARILRGELPCTKVYEDEHVLAFRDINPLAPTHVVVIPK